MYPAPRYRVAMSWQQHKAIPVSQRRHGHQMTSMLLVGSAMHCPRPGVNILLPVGQIRCISRYCHVHTKYIMREGGPDGHAFSEIDACGDIISTAVQRKWSMHRYQLQCALCLGHLAWIARFIGSACSYLGRQSTVLPVVTRWYLTLNVFGHALYPNDVISTPTG
jgi:hypothetical protein